MLAKSKSGQMFSMDGIVATLAFMMIFLAAIYVWDFSIEKISQTEKRGDLELLSKNAMAVLVETPGNPSNWSKILDWYESSTSCTIKSSCDSSETCMFSLYQKDDSHVGPCGYFSNNVCCKGAGDVTFRTLSCDAGEGIILRVSQEDDSTVEAPTGSDYETLVCGKGCTCALRDSCNTGEGSVVSLYSQTESHVGEPGYYSNLLCCSCAEGYQVKLDSLGLATASGNKNLDIHNQARSFGLTYGNYLSLDDSKLKRLVTLNQTNYQTYKKLLGLLGPDYQFQLRVDLLKEKGYVTKYRIGANSNPISVDIVRSDRMALLNESIADVILLVWQECEGDVC